MQSMDGGARPRVLVVDDMVENLNLLELLLSPKGFTVLKADSGRLALDLVAQDPPDVVLLDLVMPEMDGFQICERLKGDPRTRHIPVIILTGVTEHEANIKALELGADDFMIRPFDSVLLDARIRSAVRAKGLQDELIRHQETLEERIRERTSQIERVQQATVFSLAKLAESRDPETGEHLDRMRSYARTVARHLAEQPETRDLVNEEFVEVLYVASPLHDIGKVGIPDRILLKPGKLTRAEFDIMKSHTSIGGETLRAATTEAGPNGFLETGCRIAYYHHERWDGNGYPRGLKADEIPLEARIVALGDVYDALTSKRPYKEAFPHDVARRIILEGRGTQFDPRVVDAFLAMEAEFVSIQKQYHDTGEPTALQRLIRVLEEMDAADQRGDG